jgi:hypothetical protein
MSADEASDVTKALAAFGAPAIRYHSFGHGQLRPSSVVLPSRERALPAAELALEPAPQPILTAAPARLAPPRSHAPLLAPLGSPPPGVPPLGAPLRHANPPAAEPHVAPPPRPLAEWAAPTSPLQAPLPPGRPIPIESAAPVTPSFVPSTPIAAPRQMVPPTPVAPTPAVVPAPVAPAPVASPPLVAAAPRRSASLPEPVATARPAFAAAPAPARGVLADMFRFLAEGPEATASSQRAVPEMFHKS